MGGCNYFIISPVQTLPCDFITAALVKYAAATLICNVYFTWRGHLHMQLMSRSNFVEGQFRNWRLVDCRGEGEEEEGERKVGES